MRTPAAAPPTRIAGRLVHQRPRARPRAGLSGRSAGASRSQCCDTSARKWSLVGMSMSPGPRRRAPPAPQPCARGPPSTIATVRWRSGSRGPRAVRLALHGDDVDPPVPEGAHDGDTPWVLDPEHDGASARFAAVGGGSRHGRVLLVIRIPSVRTRRAVGVLSGAQQALFRHRGCPPAPTRVAGSTGLEPAASGLTGQCANQAAPRPRCDVPRPTLVPSLVGGHLRGHALRDTECTRFRTALRALHRSAREELRRVGVQPDRTCWLGSPQLRTFSRQPLSPSARCLGTGRSGLCPLAIARISRSPPIALTAVCGVLIYMSVRRSIRDTSACSTPSAFARRS